MSLVCPKCGSGNIYQYMISGYERFSTDNDSNFQCQSCGWVGVGSELMEELKYEIKKVNDALLP